MAREGQRRDSARETQRRRSARIRREKRRRRLIRRIKISCILTLFLVFSVIVLWNLGAHFLKDGGPLSGRDAWTIEAPIERDEEEALKKLRELGKKDKTFLEICEHSEDYPPAMLAALANNPEMLEFVKGYPRHEPAASGELTKKEKKEEYPLFIQWDERWGYASYGSSNIGISGCGPTCLSMVVFALTDDTSATPDKIAGFSQEEGYYVEGTGTSWELMTSGAAAFGITGAELSLDESSMKRELDQNHPIICAMRAGDFTAAGHFIMIYGYDKSGFFVNDPNCLARSEKKWTYEDLRGQIKNLWSYHI